VSGVVVGSTEGAVVSAADVSLVGVVTASVEVAVSLFEVVAERSLVVVVLGVELVLESVVVRKVVDLVDWLLVVVVALVVAVVSSVTVSALACLAPTKNRPLKTALEMSNRLTNPVDVILNSPV
jgi:hypothetical protein